MNPLFCYIVKIRKLVARRLSMDEIFEGSAIRHHLIKAERLIALSSSINKLIIHARKETEIIEGICRISVEDGKFIMSWFGLANVDSGYLDPISSFGRIDGYFDSIPKISFTEIQQGMGPAGRAYRERKLVVNNDIADVTDAQYNLWREAALSRGYRSSVGIPVFKDGKLYGVFSLYHEQPFFFTNSEQKLLQDIGDNLTFSINNLHVQSQKEILQKKLSSAYSDLTEAHAQLDQFTYRASHDLRGPIATLLGLCEVSKVERDGFPVTLDLLNKIELTAIRLDKTLKRFITALDVRHQHIESSPVSFPELFVKINSKFHEGGLCLSTRVEECVRLHSDSTLLLIALENMIENSLQHKNPAADCCGVEILVKEIENETIKISVIDNGTGILPEITSRIFEMFFRGSDRSRGPGIGLYMVKNIISRLGGTVALSSSTPAGTEFNILLPKLHAAEF